MYPILLLILIGLLTTGCGQPPRQQRTNGLGNYPIYNDDRSPYKYQDEEGNPSNNNDETAVPDDVKHCRWAVNGSSELESADKHLSPEENNTAEGAFTFCQGQNNKADIYVQLKHPIIDHKLCFFPINTTGNITKKLGRANCQTIAKPETIYNFVLSQTQHTHLSINGVLAMRDKEYVYPPTQHKVVPPIYYEKCNQYGRSSSYCRIFKGLGKYVLHQFNN